MTTKGVEQEIWLLEQEIETLQEKLECSQPLSSGSTLIKPLDATLLQDRPGYNSFVSLQKQLEVTEVVTGIHITDVQRSPGNCNVIRGRIGETEFVLQYQVKSTEGEDSTPCVSGLKISVKQAQPEHVTQFIQKCETTSNIQDFFQGFSSYMKWCEHREKTFAHYVERYPQCVCVKQREGGPVMQATTERAVYCVSWSHVISEDLGVLPLIHLYIDTKHTGPVQESLPEKFASLLTKHGIETAIDTLLECIP